MMETTIQIVWWIGLIGALVLTVVILKEVALIHKVLRDISHLSGRTRTASQGIAAHVDAAEELEALAQGAGTLSPTAKALAAAAEQIEQVLAALPPGNRAGRRGKRGR